MRKSFDEKPFQTELCFCERFMKEGLTELPEEI